MKPALASAKLSNGIEETAFDGSLVPEQTNPNGSVNNNTTTVHREEDRLDVTDVYNRSSSILEHPIKDVFGNNQEHLRMETHLEDKDVEFG